MQNAPQLASGAQSPARSLQMINCLRDRFLYSEKKARDIVFRVLEDILRASHPTGRYLILSRLSREVANEARREAQSVGFEFSNWDTASKAVINAMLAAGVLLTDNNAHVSTGITALGTRITGLTEGYRDLTEAYLLEFLIRSLGDVSIRDHKALAHALFRQFDRSISMEDFEDRVAILLSTLASRVTLREDGAYAVLADAATL